MNKKIFTLLTGALLLFAAAFSASAQSAIDGQKLRIGDPVKKLEAIGTSEGFYALQVDSINATTTTTGIGIHSPTATLDTAIVLFMGDSATLGSKFLFIDTIQTGFRDFGSLQNTARSAASLWCVQTEKWDNNQPIIFDFTNKYYNEMLDVDNYDYDYDLAAGANAADTVLIPGGLNGWHFSTVATTTLQQTRFLYTYTGNGDEVAVLALASSQALPTTLGAFPSNGTGALEVVVKYAANVTAAAQVQGLLWFSIVEPKPFTLSASDINTALNTTTAGVQKLLFNPDVDDNHDNVFADPGIKALDIDGALTDGTDGAKIWRNDGYTLKEDVTEIADLEALGYVVLQSGSKYVYVDTSYYADKKITDDGYRFPKIALSSSLPNSQSTNDSIMIGQYAWRFVYDPMSEQVLVNAYKATFYPRDEFDGTHGTLPDLQHDPITGQKYLWTDTLVQAWYTFVADDSTLVDFGGSFEDVIASPLRQELYPHITGPSAAYSGGTTLARPDYDVPAAGVGYIQDPYRQSQRLYLGIQELTSTNRVLTLVNNPTKYYFDVYDLCSGTTAKYTSIEPYVYLIRNAAGTKFLEVPLYSTNDSAIWHELEPSEDPVLLPSYHWIVERRYSSLTAPFTIRNREFPWLKFEGIQLKVGDATVFQFRKAGTSYTWNTEVIDVSAPIKHSDWVKATSKPGASFIKIDEDEYRLDPHLGYEYIKPEDNVTNVFALKVGSGVADEIGVGKYIGWEGTIKEYPATDTTVYVNSESYFDKLYFSFDTLAEKGYGEPQPYGYIVKDKDPLKGIIVTLERQAYRLTYEDPLKYRCINNTVMTNAADGSYAIGSKGYYKDFLGKAIFYLRWVYANEASPYVNTDNPGDQYFALVQRIDTTTVKPGNGANPTIDNLEAYLKTLYNTQLVQNVMNSLTSVQTGGQPPLKLEDFDNDAHYYNPGMFVAALESHTTILRTKLRADVNNVVTTFAKEIDTDPLYRRFNTAKEGLGYDVATGTYAENTAETDHPKLVSFYEIGGSKQEYFLFENSGGKNADGTPLYTDQYNTWIASNNTGGGKNYLGYINTVQHPSVETAIYVDTAYVNRGTGYIKPQYMLVVRPEGAEPKDICDNKGNIIGQTKGYLQGYYLINSFDWAHPAGLPADKHFLWNTSWERPIFVKSIHVDDTLFVLDDPNLQVYTQEVYDEIQKEIMTTSTTGVVVDVAKLHKYAETKGSKIKYWYLGNNYHKDCVWQFRLIERRADDFLIESETTDRDVPGKLFAPCDGGWIKTQNYVPVISSARSDKYDMPQGAQFNVIPGGDLRPVATEEVASPVAVVGGTGTVTILNAAGKSVTITNILGQTVTTTVLTSDNATLSAPQGIVVVAVKGEPAVKALVK
ncbi:MAG: DUF6383 domain-containing protein [Tannerella sp.]|nr:DUF6383 domain-containing protein [Tannerella sp.]